MISGAGSGIGRGIALAFAAEGARLGLCGRRPALLGRVVDEIRDAGGEAVAFRADVAREADVGRAVSGVVRAFGRLDVLVNNAALYRPARLADTRPSDWDETLAVNLRGAFLLARAALPHLVKSRGSVLNISSNIGLRPVPGSAAYCVSKAGLDMLTRVLAIEGAADGVRANSLLLGIVDTPIHRSRSVADHDAWLGQAARLHPLGRIGQPADAAQAAVYLSSGAASWVTGALLSVDGGLSLV